MNLYTVINPQLFNRSKIESPAPLAQSKPFGNAGDITVNEI